MYQSYSGIVVSVCQRAGHGARPGRQRGGPCQPGNRTSRMGLQAPSPLYATAAVTDNIVFTIVTFTRTTRLPTRFAVSVTVPRTNAIAAIDDDNVVAGGARP